MFRYWDDIYVNLYFHFHVTSYVNLMLVNTYIGNCHADHVASSICTSWQSLRRQAVVARSV
jgi:hypothetical protein